MRYDDEDFYDADDSETATGATSIDTSQQGCITGFRLKCGNFINNFWVQAFILACITVNAAMMGIGTYPIVRQNPQVQAIWDLVDNMFLILFTFELIMQFIYHGWELFTYGWLCFDFLIIVLSWFLQGAQIIRAFRVFRVLRLVPRVKPMRDVVQAIIKVLPRMCWVAVMLFIVFYIFAVFFTSLYKDIYKEGYTEIDYFSRLDATSFTLFQIMCLDDWSGIAREVIAYQHAAWLPLVVYVIISGFVIFNLFVAVICDSIQVLRQDELRSKGNEEISLKEIREEVNRLEVSFRLMVQVQADTNRMIQNLITEKKRNAPKYNTLPQKRYHSIPPAQHHRRPDSPQEF